MKILNLCTEYCNDLYNNQINHDTHVLSNTAIFNEKSETELQILYIDIMDAINTLNKSKSPGINKIPSALIKH